MYSASWGAWNNWSQCSQTCGGGIKYRVRKCDSAGGEECKGRNFDARICNNFQCKSTRTVNGSWGGWSDWSQCSKSCGGGTEERDRSCSSPAPAHGGEDCQGKPTELRTCNKDNCKSIKNGSMLNMFSFPFIGPLPLPQLEKDRCPRFKTPTPGPAAAPTPTPSPTSGN